MTTIAGWIRIELLPKSLEESRTLNGYIKRNINYINWCRETLDKDDWIYYTNYGLHYVFEFKNSEDATAFTLKFEL